MAFALGLSAKRGFQLRRGSDCLIRSKARSGNFIIMAFSRDFDRVDCLGGYDRQVNRVRPSCATRGRTLNIELIADEGALFTICYALQSCKGASGVRGRQPLWWEVAPNR